MGLIPLMQPGPRKLAQWSGEGLGNVMLRDDPELIELAEELKTLSAASDEAADLWHEIERKVVVEDALSGLLLFGSATTAYDPDVIGDPSILPYTAIPVPDPRKTYVKEGVR